LIFVAAYNTANNDAPSFDIDYSCRSIAFGAGKLIVHGAKSNGVVCRDVIRHHGSINKKISLNSRRIKT